jgi:hypothetical protein
MYPWDTLNITNINILSKVIHDSYLKYEFTGLNEMSLKWTYNFTPKMHENGNILYLTFTWVWIIT